MRSVLDLAVQVDWSDGPGWHYENEVYETGRSWPRQRRQIAMHVWRLLVTLTTPSQPEIPALVRAVAEARRDETIMVSFNTDPVAHYDFEFNLPTVSVPLTPVCVCETAMVRRNVEWVCPRRRLWNFWRHDRSHNGELDMRWTA